jgi:hypothetical protein
MSESAIDLDEKPLFSSTIILRQRLSLHGHVGVILLLVDQVTSKAPFTYIACPSIITYALTRRLAKGREASRIGLVCSSIKSSSQELESDVNIIFC